MRLLKLNLRYLWANRWKTLLLTILVLIGISVLLLVNELSAISSQGLDEAIASDNGNAGSYTLDLDLSTNAHRSSEVVAELQDSITALNPTELLTLNVLPEVSLTCPGEETTTVPTQLLVTAKQEITVPGASPVSEQIQYGNGTESKYCIFGHELEPDSLYFPADAEARYFGAGTFIVPLYQDFILANTLTPVKHRFYFNLPITTYSAATLQDKFRQEIPGLERDELSVDRIDTGENIRQATAGVKVVYGIIGWGVLSLVAIGLLVTELVSVGQKLWFFGLAMTLGAKRRHIFALVFGQIFAVILIGTGMALAVLKLSQDQVNAFTSDAFGLEANLLNPEALSGVLLAATTMLTLAGCIPAFKALRVDPLDTLEPKTA